MEIFLQEVLAEQTEEVERAWYQVLAQDLPSEMSPQELSEVESDSKQGSLESGQYENQKEGAGKLAM